MGLTEGIARHGATAAQAPSSLFAEHAAILTDPATGDAIRVDGERLTAVPSGRRIAVVDGIPNFFVPTEHDRGSALDDVTETVKAFYEETPFPNYDGFDSRDSLFDKARRGVFAAMLDEQLPKGSLVLEAGCGTGQLSNFLGMSWERKVFAGDLCLNSLRLAKGFADRYAIRNVAFLQMNLFRPPFRDESFDVVISNGVLHHTGDCEGAFRSILMKLKPGGLILIGLYNYYARLPTLWKAAIFRTLGPKLYFLDPRLRDWHREPARIKSWFRDQYQHPHETRHSIDEVLRWFGKYDVEFVNGIPHVDGSAFGERERLFEPHTAGTAANRISAQVAMLLSGGKDGGLFIMIGRKRMPDRVTRALHVKILGISAFYHDSAAALIDDGVIVAAAQEERFTRRKHDAGFPANAVDYCLQAGGASIDTVDFVAFYDKPLVKFERLLETYLAFAPRGFKSFSMAIPVWLQEKLFLRNLLVKQLRPLGTRKDLPARLLFSEHHLSHAASAFYPSPFDEAAVLTMDGVGEWATTSLAWGHGSGLEVRREIHFPHSLGLLYSAFTYYTGFKVNSGEYKVMGLAPYGTPKYAQRILDHLIDLKPDGTFRLDLSYFDYCTGLTMTNSRFDDLFEGPARGSEALLTQREMDLAASIQAVTEEVVLRLTRSIASETGATNLCLAGGVALNCVANGKVLRDGRFKNIWIQPAAGDAGGALGAALVGYHLRERKPRRSTNGAGDGMNGSFLGPSYSQEECEARLRAAGARFDVLGEDEIIDVCARELADGKALGWFQGRMEFGPRALGGRSVLGDARSPAMQSILNLKVKYRESFRPFAPSVLRERVADWFDLDHDSPYMLLVADVVKSRHVPMTPEQQAMFGIEKLNIPRSDIPAVTHVDYSARIQTVHKETNPRYYALIAAFERLTGCPVIVNTSFNVRGEPIVCTPEDAFRCFMGTEIERLAVGACLLKKEDQDPALKQQYETRFEPD